MEEKSEREKQLSEDLLERILGGSGESSQAAGSPSSSNLMAHCDQCQRNLDLFRGGMLTQRALERQLFERQRVSGRVEPLHKSESDRYYQVAQQAMAAIRAHGHPDLTEDVFYPHNRL